MSENKGWDNKPSKEEYNEEEAPKSEFKRKIFGSGNYASSIYMSKEAIEDIKNWPKEEDISDQVTRRAAILYGKAHRITQKQAAEVLSNDAELLAEWNNK